MKGDLVEDAFDRVNTAVSDAASRGFQRLRPLLGYFKHMTPWKFIKTCGVVFVILCILPTGIYFPKPLFVPVYRMIKVPGHETMPAILYTQRRPRIVQPYSSMNQKNRDYLIRSFGEKPVRTRDDIANGFRPPAPAIVFIQTARDVAKHAKKHPKGIEEHFGHLTPEVLDSLSKLNGGNIDLWIVTPKAVKELEAFLKEFCWYRSVMLVPLGAAAMRSFQASYVPDEGNMFPIFLSGMLLINPLFKESDINQFTLRQRLLAASLRVVVACNFGDIARKALSQMVPTGVTDSGVKVAVASPEFVALVTKYYTRWSED